MKYFTENEVAELLSMTAIGVTAATEAATLDLVTGVLSGAATRVGGFAGSVLKTAAARLTESYKAYGAKDIEALREALSPTTLLATIQADPETPRGSHDFELVKQLAAAEANATVAEGAEAGDRAIREQLNAVRELLATYFRYQEESRDPLADAWDNARWLTDELQKILEPQL